MTNDSAHTGWLAGALAVAVLLLVSVVPVASAEQAASDLRRAQSGYLDAGDEHTCAILADRSARCWGRGLAGRLGYGSEDNVLSGGGSGPVPFPAGRTARAIVAGDFHTCALLDDGSARCWGFGANGRLGYGSSANVLSPVSAPPVDLGPGRTATAITAGASHTCVILDTGAVRCWGNGVSGRLGYGDQRTIGDDETPAAVGTVDIGAGRTAVAISAGDFHTCAIRDDAQMVCWGFGSGGQLGYGGTSDVGDDETPGAAGPVNLGPRRVRAVSGGKGHSCAILDTGAIRCWGFGGNGRLGTGATDSIGNDPGETPASVAPVDLGAGRVGRALTVGFSHTCALLDDATVRCWGFGGSGRLGYGNETSVGDSPARSVLLAGPVPLGGVVAPTVADLSLGLSASAGSVPLGGAVSLTVSLVNRGPDATDGIAVGMPAPDGLVYRAATASQGGFAGPTGLWSVGVLPPGGSAALTVSVTAGSPGTRTIAAEVGTSTVLDPTSTPGNGAAEDDRAVVTLVVPAIALTGPTARRLPRKLGVKVARVPKRGVVKRLLVTGALTLPSGAPRLRCAGKVRVRALVGKRAVASSTVALRARRGTCTYARTLRLKRMGSTKVVRVSATFLGTALMRPRSSKAVRVRIR